jgi:uncharacterized membrane protein YbhN (UPF0104 family)
MYFISLLSLFIYLFYFIYSFIHLFINLLIYSLWFSLFVSLSCLVVFIYSAIKIPEKEIKNIAKRKRQWEQIKKGEVQAKPTKEKKSTRSKTGMIRSLFQIVLRYFIMLYYDYYCRYSYFSRALVS